MVETANLAGWLAATALAAERLWKIYSEWRAAKATSTTTSIAAADSLFRRATDMMDRIERDNASLRNELLRKDAEIATLRQRVDHLEGEVEALQTEVSDQERAIRKLEAQKQ